VKFLLSILLVLIIVKTQAQDSTNAVDVLSFKRTFINTQILKNKISLSKKNIRHLYITEGADKSLKLYRKANYFLPFGPPLVLGGIYLGYDAIKGEKRVAEIDGISHTYYIRPIKQLLGGIALFSVGICMIEYANEFKGTSVNLYNQKIKGKNASANLDLKIGFTRSGNFGVVVNF
jgi:hypothetical protein